MSSKFRLVSAFAAGALLASFASAGAAGSISSLFTDAGGGAYKLLGSSIKDGTVGAAQLADGSVTDAKVVSLSAAKVSGKVASAAAADSAAVASSVVAGSVTGASLTGSSVTSDKIADGTVASADLADGSVTASKIADGSVTAAKVVSLPYSKLTGVPSVSERDPNVDVPVYAGRASCRASRCDASANIDLSRSSTATISCTVSQNQCTGSRSNGGLQCHMVDVPYSCSAAVPLFGYIKGR